MEFVQNNHSKSKKGVLRGLHFQTRFSQGSVWDVAVDLREGSETFGKWHGLLLSEEKKNVLCPRRFCSWVCNIGR